MYVHEIKGLISRIQELETLLEQSERKSDILTNLLIEANAEFERALEQATESEANIRVVFENAPEAIYMIDAETWAFFYCNPYTISWLGYEEHELLSMRVTDILETGSQGIKENIQKAIAWGLVRVQERRFRKKDGTVVDAEVTGTIVEYRKRKYLVAFVRDVTERKQIEALSRYKELFENVSDPVFINDTDGHFLEANDVACVCFGYERDSLLGRSLQEFVSPTSWRKLQSLEEGIQRRGRIQLELEILTRNNEMIPFELHARAITFMGRPGALSVARDLSVRKQMEQALVKSARLTAVGEMASGVAHNFNNFLQMITSAGEAAMSKLEAGKIREAGEAISNILNASRRGADIVRRMRDFRDVRPDDLEESKVFDLGELIEEAVNLTRPLWQNLPDSRKYRINVIKGLGCFVRGKPSALYEVLVNLIKNALEAMPRGGILTICSRVQKKYVILKVNDTGHGISPDDCQRIFEPFFTTKGSKNSGLGLASSYGIIKKHQGEISVASEQKKGTTFTIALPLCEKFTIEESKPVDSRKREKLRFLVIDDEINILKAMTMFFEDTNVDIVTANTGKDGIEKLNKADFDVALCDLGMEDMDGWEVGAEIRKHYLKQGKRKIPFLLYTGMDKQFDSSKLEECGVDRVVRKPVSCEELMNIIQEVVSFQRDNAAPSGKHPEESPRPR